MSKKKKKKLNISTNFITDKIFKSLYQAIPLKLFLIKSQDSSILFLNIYFVPITLILPAQK